MKKSWGIMTIFPDPLCFFFFSFLFFFPGKETWQHKTQQQLYLSSCFEGHTHDELNALQCLCLFSYLNPMRVQPKCKRFFFPPYIFVLVWALSVTQGKKRRGRFASSVSTVCEFSCSFSTSASSPTHAGVFFFHVCKSF